MCYFFTQNTKIVKIINRISCVKILKNGRLKLITFFGMYLLGSLKSPFYKTAFYFELTKKVTFHRLEPNNKLKINLFIIKH